MEMETLAEIEINEIDKIGPKGLSAYEVYVKNGGTLSETEWLESLRGEQGPQGAPGAVKMQVVDTLPDVGETDTIYLLKKGIPSQQNLYDEYVYANGSWEHIGDTSVDLTDYYTRGDLLTCYVKSNIYLPGLSTGAKENINVNALTEIQNFINDNFGKIAKFAVVAPLSNLPTLFEPFETDGKNTFPILKNKPTSIILAGYYKNRHFGSGVSSDSLMSATMSLMQMVLTLSWVENTCTITAGYIRRATGTDRFVGVTYMESYFLEKNNSKSYTPSGPYNPATKKYVDDNKYTLPVASAETLGGIKLGEGLNADENGVVSASSSGLLNDTIRVIKLPESLYFGPGNGGGFFVKITDTDFVENVNSILTDIYNLKRTKTPNNMIILFTMPSGNNETYFGFTQPILNEIPTASGQQSFNFYIYIISCVRKKTRQVLYGFDIAFKTYIENNQVRIDDERITETYNVAVTPQTWASGGGKRAVYETDGKPLGILNTTEFTPTKDYHPATKKYADDLPKSYTGYDATKTQTLKNINGVLTWVDEG